MKTTTLAEAACDFPRATKWLVAPSMRVANQWIESLVRSGQPAVNWRPTTIDRLAVEFAGPALIEKSLAIVSDWVGTLAIKAAWEKLPSDGYFGRLPSSSSVPKLVARAIAALRVAGVDLDSIDKSMIADSDKLTELKSLGNQYLAFLDEYGLVDQADVLRLAISAVSRQFDQHAVVLIPVETQLAGLPLICH